MQQTRLSAVRVVNNLALDSTPHRRNPRDGLEPMVGAIVVPARSSGRVHHQLSVLVEGWTADHHEQYDLRTVLVVNGARWRSSSHRLCTSLQPRPQEEFRRCVRNSSGAFSAAIWVPLLASVPVSSPAQRAAAERSREAALRPFMKELAGEVMMLDACALLNRSTTAATATAIATAATPPPAVLAEGGLCFPPLLKRVSPWAFSSHAKRLTRYDLFGSDWEPIAAAFALAAKTLPQPFGIIESGNFCGGTRRLRLTQCARSTLPTLLLLPLYSVRHCVWCRRDALSRAAQAALLPGVPVRLHRPRAVSPPPRPAVHVRVRRGEMGGARRYGGADRRRGGGVTAAGRADRLHVLGCRAAPALGAPRLERLRRAMRDKSSFLGSRADDGKFRIFNDPLLSHARDRMLLGGVIALDDVWQPDEFTHAQDHIGQVRACCYGARTHFLATHSPTSTSPPQPPSHTSLQDSSDQRAL